MIMTKKNLSPKGLKTVKVLIDTNVILDVLCNRRDFVENSSKVWKLCEVKKLVGCVSALSVPNIVYILRKELDPDKTKEVIDHLFLIFEIIDLKPEDLKKAADMKNSDFEDALQMVCAARISADFIVTRNIRDFYASSVMAVKPSELLERI